MGAQLVDLVSKRGGIPFHAPALAEVPDFYPDDIARLIDEWKRKPFKAAIFQTGVGTRALFDATGALGLRGDFLQLLAQTVVVARGPKPTGALRSHAVRIDRSAAEPYTTAEVLSALDGLPLAAERVLVQSYGEPNRVLDDALEKMGASVSEIPTYRWALPHDLQPLRNLLDALAKKTIDAVVFTSASQVRNFVSVARSSNQERDLVSGLNLTLVASIGPVCSKALSAHGIEVRLEAQPPKLGPLLAALDNAWK